MNNSITAAEAIDIYTSKLHDKVDKEMKRINEDILKVATDKFTHKTETYTGHLYDINHDILLSKGFELYYNSLVKCWTISWNVPKSKQY